MDNLAYFNVYMVTYLISRVNRKSQYHGSEGSCDLSVNSHINLSAIGAALTAQCLAAPSCIALILFIVLAYGKME